MGGLNEAIKRNKESLCVFIDYFKKVVVSAWA